MFCTKRFSSTCKKHLRNGVRPLIDKIRLVLVQKEDLVELLKVSDQVIQSIFIASLIAGIIKQNKIQ